MNPMTKPTKNRIVDKVAGALMRLDQGHPSKALWSHAGVDYYDAARIVLRLCRRHYRNAKGSGGTKHRTYAQADQIAEQIHKARRDNPRKSQAELGAMLGISRSMVSYYLRRVVL